MNAKKKVYEGCGNCTEMAKLLRRVLAIYDYWIRLKFEHKNSADVTVPTISVDNEIPLDLFILSHTPKQESYTSNRIV